MLYTLEKLNIAFESIKAIENAFVLPQGKIVGTAVKGSFEKSLTLICENNGYIFRDDRCSKFGCCSHHISRFEAVRHHLTHGEAWLEE